MNDSGQAVQSIREYYHINLDHIVVIHDDMDLEFGRIKLKSGGSAGGHNGIKSIDRCLHSPDYARVRMGVGHASRSGDAHDNTINWVLGEFNAAQRKQLPEFLADGADAAETIVFEGSRKLRINSMPDDKARHSNANRSAEETYNELMNGSLLSLRQRLLEDQAFAGLVEGHVDAARTRLEHPRRSSQRHSSSTGRRQCGP